jgi:hypothetical protein
MATPGIILALSIQYVNTILGDFGKKLMVNLFKLVFAFKVLF